MRALTRMKERLHRWWHRAPSVCCWALFNIPLSAVWFFGPTEQIRHLARDGLIGVNLVIAVVSSVQIVRLRIQMIRIAGRIEAYEEMTARAEEMLRARSSSRQQPPKDHRVN